MPTIREFARLTIDRVPSSLDQATIPLSAFEWLVDNARGGDGTPALAGLDGPRSIRVLNYVGVLETPDGTRLEILPKYTDSAETIEGARRLLVKMVVEALRLKPRLGTQSDISSHELPLPEWLALRFLEEASDLIRRGLRRNYQQTQAREPYLRGSLDIVRQIRSGAAVANLLAINHDIFSFDRPENRLIRSALEVILHSTHSSANWRLARELATVMTEVPESVDVEADLRKWVHGRLTMDYRPIKALCELILRKRTPFAFAGRDRGLSLLFPMEKLFEEYVLTSLVKAVPPSMRVRAQFSDAHLCDYEGGGWFRLRPDIVVSDGEQTWIVDSKWKLLSPDRSSHYGLSQSDFYQLFAYGEKYLHGTGDLFLVYPRTASFPEQLAPFSFSPDLRLHVLPFDLNTRTAAYSFLANR